MRLFVTAITFVGIFSLPHWAIITMNALVYGRLDLSKHCELFNERGSSEIFFFLREQPLVSCCEITL